ncbi:MAG TPA: efflux RND transporter periplasmic adaptor subunit [Candidatus Baltobacteraceae bacterium]|nr:efflux RND transporter periplasmic adaptor subunit [Candidatus Baltobacteraceae bacterium]
MKRLVWLVLVALLAACAKHVSQPPPPYVQTSLAQEGTVVPASAISGLIAPFENVAIQSTLVEPADTVNVREGDRVTKGEVLAQLDTADLQAQLQSDLATAQSDAANTEHTVYSGNESITQGSQTLNAARASLARDQAVMERDGALYRQGYVSLQQYQSDQATVRNDEANLRSAIATVQANGSSLTAPGLQQSSIAQARAQEQVALAQAQQVRVSIAKATIISPIDGVVVNRNLNPGEYPGTREIFTLQQVSPIYAVLRGSASQIAGVRPGETATITTDGALGPKKFTGTVVGVLNEIQPGSTQFQVKVVLQNRQRLLRPGMAVSGSVTLPSVHGVVVPTTAFTDDNHDSVQTVQQPNNTLKTLPVTEVAGDGTHSVVTGIPAGTRVVNNGQSSLGDGEKISLRP